MQPIEVLEKVILKSEVPLHFGEFLKDGRNHSWKTAPVLYGLRKIGECSVISDLAQIDVEDDRLVYSLAVRPNQFGCLGLFEPGSAQLPEIFGPCSEREIIDHLALLLKQTYKQKMNDFDKVEERGSGDIPAFY